MKSPALTLKQKAFIDDYLICGNKLEAYVKAYSKKNVNKNTRKDACETFKKKLVQKYYEDQMVIINKSFTDKHNKIIEESLVDKKYIIKNLVKVIDENEGKPCAVKALELLGRHVGLFWAAPAEEMSKRFVIEDNAKAVKQITEMVQDGTVTISAASDLMALIDDKSKIEEREDTNSEILEKLNNLEKMAKEKELSE